MKGRKINRRAYRVPGVHTTTDLSVAMKYGYIGESTMMPSTLSFSIRAALGLRPLPYGTIYYFGTPDEATSKRFGYD